jgi:hypothetical protein
VCTKHYEITKALLDRKLAEGSSVREHEIKVVGLTRKLEALDYLFPTVVSTDLILGSLPPSYQGFTINYYMTGVDKSLAELFGSLKAAEVEMLKTKYHEMMAKREMSEKSSKV